MQADELFGMPIVVVDGMPSDSLALVEFGDFGAFMPTIAKFSVTSEVIAAAEANGMDVKTFIENVVREALDTALEKDMEEMYRRFWYGEGDAEPKGILGG